jgi:hypothetical protein
MDLSALESSVRALERSLDSWSFWLVVSTLLVVVGLVLEYWHEVRDLIKERPFRWKQAQKILGAVLVIVGVAGELVIQFKASAVETDLRAANGKVTVALSKKAGDAQTSADNAAKDVGVAELAAGKANALAQSASLKVAALDKEAGDAEKRALEAEEQAARLRQQLEWRSLSDGQRGEICKSLSPLSGVRVAIEYSVGDAEGAQYAADFFNALTICKWLPSPPGASLIVGVLPEGVSIHVKEPNNPAAVALQRALRAAKVQTDGVLNPGMEPDAIELFIGIKPRPITATSARKK